FAIAPQALDADAGPDRKGEACRVRLEVIGHLILARGRVRIAGERHPRQPVVTRGCEQPQRIPAPAPRVPDSPVRVQNDARDPAAGQLIPGGEAGLAAADDDGVYALGGHWALPEANSASTNASGCSRCGTWPASSITRRGQANADAATCAVSRGTIRSWRPHSSTVGVRMPESTASGMRFVPRRISCRIVRFTWGTFPRSTQYALNASNQAGCCCCVARGSRNAQRRNRSWLRRVGSRSNRMAASTRPSGIRYGPTPGAPERIN